MTLKMSKQFKIPAFISDYFNSLGQTERQEAIERYKSWYSHDYTELFREYLETEHKKLVKEDEEKSDFVSWFQFSYVSIRNKSARKVLKTLLNKMEWKV